MKILFSAGEFDKQLHAVNKIVLNLSEQLCIRGHECIFTGVSIFDGACTEQKGNLKLVRFNSHHFCDKAFLALENFVHKNGLSREDAKKKFYLRHPLYTAALLYRYNISKKALYNVKSYSKQLSALAKKEQPDVLVVSYMPFAHAHDSVVNAKLDIPVIAYQMDPWGLHCNIADAQQVQKNISEETALFDRCTKIVTTPVLYKQYMQHPAYQKYIDKMIPLNFPNVRPLPQIDTNSSVFDFDTDIVNLLFCGIVHDEYRNPQFLLDCLKAVRQKGFDRFKVYFLGVNESSSLTRFMAENDWVTHHHSVPLEKAFSTMFAADVLINIGNTYNNQVPSKIFDYFALGKPVLNIERIADCPAKEFFARYPDAFTLKEWNAADTSVNVLADFLISSKGKHTDYSCIEQLFFDCTLNYATDVFCDIINKI